MTTVRYEVEDGVATITLDRPSTMNAMTLEFMAELRSAIQRVHDEPEVRVLVITGAGRGFCAGADLADQAGGGGGESRSIEELMDEVFHPVNRALMDCPVPTVARINGPTAGAGIGLALTCDVAVAARSAFFAATFGPKLGIVPDMGVTWHLQNLVGPAHARAIAMLGDRIPADDAQRMGLIWQVVDDDDLDDAVGAIVSRLRTSSPDAMTRIRSAIADAPGHTLNEQMLVEAAHQAVLIPRNMGEGARAFVEKRTPVFGPERQER
jgi:2-(1,2-epoxy-1,2-dihydrophenyl)acetyl-CoA isomerase